MEFVWISALSIWVGKYEVTNGKYRMAHPTHDSGAYHFDQYSLNGDRQPVVEVTVAQATAFADWLTNRERTDGRLPEGWAYRLPGDYEWTTLARCGDDREYPWGNEWPPTYGNYADQSAAAVSTVTPGIPGYNDGYVASCPVEASGRNDWGLYGVGGNVNEWTTQQNEDGSHAARGGQWWSRSTTGSHLTVMYRFFPVVKTHTGQIGFRLVLGQDK
jgi:formylglycine-generating enzyme required for sulfatase activity